MSPKQVVKNILHNSLPWESVKIRGGAPSFLMISPCAKLRDVFSLVSALRDFYFHILHMVVDHVQLGIVLQYSDT